MHQQQQTIDLQQQTISNLQGDHGSTQPPLPRDLHVVEPVTTSTLVPYQELIEKYPAIMEQDFYTAELADGHDFFKLSNYTLTEGMVYKAPPVLDHAEVKLSNAAKLHDSDLATVQSRMAHHTRFYDTCAHDIIRMGWDDSEPGRHMLSFLNTLRLAAGNDAAKISKMRSKLYYTALGIKHEIAKQGSLLKVEKVAADKAASDLIHSVYSVPTAAKANNNDSKTGNKDSNKSGWKKSSSGSNNNNKSSDNTSFKKKKQQSSSGGKSSNSGNKSSGSGSGNKTKKKPEQGNDGEESE
ncbi:hypothetical protein EC991_008931 [Linnemannia zychae]|nr:hypothetical protein EC991_008931 [Linnemannia zychae]